VVEVDEGEVYECIRFMSSCYQVPEPHVLIGDEFFRNVPRKWVAYYDDKTKTIYLRPERLEERTVVHEFAHHLQTVFGIPNERGAEEFEEVAECKVCNKLMPTPDMELGAKALCPWCRSVYKLVEEESPQFPVGNVLGLTAVILASAGLIQAYQYKFVRS